MAYHDTVQEGGMIVKLTDKTYVDLDEGELKARDQRSNLVDRRRALRQVLCYICCAEFGSSSLAIHQKTCLKKHKWGLDIVEFEEGVPRKKALANRKKCVEPGTGPTQSIPGLKCSSQIVENYNTEALKIFYEHSEHCLWCRTKNFEAIENAQHATDDALRRTRERELSKGDIDDREAKAKAAAEAAAKAQEALDKAARDEAARKLAEEEVRRLAEELARRKAQEEEEARRRAQEEEEAMKRALEEAEAYRLAVEAEEKHRKEEEEARRLHEERIKAALKFAEEEAAKRKAAEEEWAKLAAELLTKKRQEEEAAHLKKMKEEADEAKRKALELAFAEAAAAKARAEEAKHALEEQRRLNAALKAAADADAKNERLIKELQEEEALRRINSDKELLQKKKKILGKHKFLRKHEGAVASSQGAATYFDKKHDEEAIKDFTSYSIKHAKQEHKIIPHHQVFKHREFNDVGEGITYEVIEDEYGQPIYELVNDAPSSSSSSSIQEQQQQQQAAPPQEQTKAVSPSSSTLSSSGQSVQTVPSSTAHQIASPSTGAPTVMAVTEEGLAYDLVD